MDQLTGISSEVAAIGSKLEALMKRPELVESVDAVNVVKELLAHVDALGMSLDRVCKDHLVMARTLAALTNKAAWLKRYSHQRGCYEHVFMGTADVKPAILGSGADMVSAVGNRVMDEAKREAQAIPQDVQITEAFAEPQADAGLG